MSATAGGARGIALLAVAVVIGIVLLQDLDAPPGEDTAAPVTTTTEFAFDDTPVGTPTTTGAVARPPTEVKVLVVNASGINGLAAIRTKEINGAGYSVLAPATATTRIPATSVQYTEDYAEDARSVARVLGLSPDVVTELSSPPVRSVSGANVVVILGTDSEAPAAGGSSSTTSSTSTTLG